MPPISYEEAVILANEIAESLGGRQAEALRVLMRYAERGRRNSTAAQAVQHFKAAASELPPKKDDR